MVFSVQQQVQVQQLAGGNAPYTCIICWAQLHTGPAMCACPPLYMQSMAALHSLPTMVRSFTQRPPQRSQSGSLLVEGSQLSDGQLAPGGARASLAPEKSNQSAGAMLTCISVVASAGVQPSSSSMPNLQRPATGSRAVSFSQQQQGQRQSNAGADSVPAPAEQAAHAGQLSLQASPTAASSATLGFSDAPDPAAGATRPSRQLSRQLSPAAAAIAAATAAAARPSLQPSLASPQPSLASSLPVARQSFAFRVGGGIPRLHCTVHMCCSGLIKRADNSARLFPPSVAADRHVDILLPHSGLPACRRCPPSSPPWRPSARRA